jgi:hypothetical protein
LVISPGSAIAALLYSDQRRAFSEWNLSDFATMAFTPRSYNPTEEKVGVSLDEEQTIRRTGPPGYKTFVSVVVLLFVGLLGLLSVVKLNIPLLNAFSIEHVDEKTSYTPRQATPGDLYLLGVGKADITGFVHHHF